MKDKIYVYKYKITEENLDLIRIEDPSIKKTYKINWPGTYLKLQKFSR